MKLEITDAAADWYIDEMDLEAGDFIQFFAKIYGGIPTAHSNYFLGISVGDTGKIGINTEVKGITFYFDEKDAWLLDEYDLKVEMGEDEVEYNFIEK
ncbi:hypothetical protein CIL05_18320 [Virgibacillus profundi]|uniref:FeS cluster biogenesis domain-containing protein n=1 Tax=Virgibacillus profundi TaxID=2024555 RepID=A0A2A2I9R7_9BACI|nr:hypothetical protein [Virgibacillus profundi]PAV28066.1 hypothetical protein CIL05_18320 [Virgibacillus profundi]PXY52370.1 hypothetical protein CIT14_17765 [Virgibacillus profundi]